MGFSLKALLLLPAAAVCSTNLRSQDAPPVQHPCASHYENPHPDAPFPETPNWDCCEGETFYIPYSPHAICAASCDKPSRRPFRHADETGGCPQDIPSDSTASPYCFHNGDPYNDDFVNPQPHVCALKCGSTDDCPSTDMCLTYTDDWGDVGLCVGWQYGGYEGKDELTLDEIQ